MGDISLAEPNPKGDAEETLTWLWPLHVYFFAVSFLIIALLTICVQIFTRERKLSVKTLMLCAVIILALSRSILLFIDPYLTSGSTSLWWKFTYVLITGLGSTSLTASLAILLYITTISTHVTSIHRQVRLRTVVCGVTITNFAFFITSDVVAMLSKEGKFMLTACQIGFSLWGIVISSGFAFLRYKLRENARATFEQTNRNTNLKREETKLQKLSVLLAILSVTAGVFFVLRIYEAISGLTRQKYSETWPWWTLQTLLRTFEILTTIVLLLVFRKENYKDQENNQEDSEYRKPTWKNNSINTSRFSMGQI